MKKITAILMALTLCITMSTAAFAAPITTNGGTDNKDVTGTYQAGSGSSMVYSVDVSWGAMEFTYTGADAGTWNPANHQYDGGGSGAWSWTAESNKITVTNHSNAAVTAGLAFSNAGGAGTSVAGGFFTTTTGGTTVTSIPLATADGMSVASAPTGAAYFQVTGGTLTSGTTGEKIGTITVTLS